MVRIADAGSHRPVTISNGSDPVPVGFGCRILPVFRSHAVASPAVWFEHWTMLMVLPGGETPPRDGDHLPVRQTRTGRPVASSRGRGNVDAIGRVMLVPGFDANTIGSSMGSRRREAAGASCRPSGTRRRSRRLRRRCRTPARRVHGSRDPRLDGQHSLRRVGLVEDVDAGLVGDEFVVGAMDEQDRRSLRVVEGSPRETPTGHRTSPLGLHPIVPTTRVRRHTQCRDVPQ